MQSTKFFKALLMILMLILTFISCKPELPYVPPPLIGTWRLYLNSYTYYELDGSVNAQGVVKLPRNSILEKWVVEIDESSITNSTISKSKDIFPYGDQLETYSTLNITDYTDDELIGIQSGTTHLVNYQIVGSLMIYTQRVSSREDVLLFVRDGSEDQITPDYLPDQIEVSQFDQTKLRMTRATPVIDSSGYVVYTFVFSNNYAQSIQQAEIDITYMQYNGGWGTNHWFNNISAGGQASFSSDETYQLFHDDLWYVDIECRNISF